MGVTGLAARMNAPVYYTIVLYYESVTTIMSTTGHIELLSWSAL